MLCLCVGTDTDLPEQMIIKLLGIIWLLFVKHFVIVDSEWRQVDGKSWDECRYFLSVSTTEPQSSCLQTTFAKFRSQWNLSTAVQKRCCFTCSTPEQLLDPPFNLKSSNSEKRVIRKIMVCFLFFLLAFEDFCNFLYQQSTFIFSHQET